MAAQRVQHSKNHPVKTGHAMMSLKSTNMHILCICICVFNKRKKDSLNTTQNKLYQWTVS